MMERMDELEKKVNQVINNSNHRHVLPTMPPQQELHPIKHQLPQAEHHGKKEEDKEKENAVDDRERLDNNEKESPVDAKG